MTAPSVETIAFHGGRLCLDFVNTANWIDGTPVDDRLVDADAVRIWVERKGLTSDGRFDVDLAELRALRLAIRHVFAVPDGPVRRDIDLLNEARSNEAARLKPTRDSLRLEPPASGHWIARQIADSAVELLLSVERPRIKRCDGTRCGWLFVDESPNNRRRWCSMADCGNRAKARRFYRANKGKSGADMEK